MLEDCECRRSETIRHAMIMQVDDLTNVSLGDHLRTLIAAEVSHIESGSGKFTPSPTEVQDGVGFSVHHIRVLRTHGVLRVSPPGEVLVIEPGWRPIVPDGQDPVVRGCDTGTYLCARVLGSHRSDLSESHEHLVPGDNPAPSGVHLCPLPCLFLFPLALMLSIVCDPDIKSLAAEG